MMKRTIFNNCFMRNWAIFVKNVYKDESYLTHTLPISKNKIYLSKILTVVITLFVLFIVSIICIAVAILNEETWLFLKTFLEQSTIYFDSLVFSLLFVMIVTVFFMIITGILGIIIGHRLNNYKICI